MLKIREVVFMKYSLWWPVSDVGPKGFKLPQEFINALNNIFYSFSV